MRLIFLVLTIALYTGCAPKHKVDTTDNKPKITFTQSCPEGTHVEASGCIKDK